MSPDSQNTVVRLRQELRNRRRATFNNNKSMNAKSEKNKPEDPRKIDDLVNFIEGKKKELENHENKVKKITKKLEQLNIEKDSNVKQKKVQQQQLKEKEKHKQKENNQKHVSSKLLSKNNQIKKVTAPLKDRTNYQNKPHSKLQEHKAGCTCTCSKSTKSAKPKRENPSVEPLRKIPSTAMLTIRRTMEPEPKVTVTVKGSKPEEEKLLYTIVNGELQLVDSDQQESSMTKTQRRKIKKEKGQETQTTQQKTMDNIEIINAEITRKILEQQNISLPPCISLTKVRKPSAPQKPMQLKRQSPSQQPPSLISIVGKESSKTDMFVKFLTECSRVNLPFHLNPPNKKTKTDSSESME